ncbi:MAG: ribonuclease H-like domain-containing protein [Lachnospiraceae bacterium]|nr:ribonuclease H-like domain-containing protein [Lachnospiraceae bacterium]
MRTETEILHNFTIKYPLGKIAPLEKILFLDIETTGFQAASSTLYLIGLAYYENNDWHLIQWLAETYEEEKVIINAFFQFSAGFTHLFHYNGNNFDLPFIMQKCAKYGFSYHFDNFIGIDIYRRITPYRERLGLPNCKQKTIENFLKVKRLDLYDGGDLISVYHDYVSSPSNEGRYLMLLHNSSDLKGLLSITPILAYHDMFNGKIKVRKVQANYFTDIRGKSKNMLYMKLKLKTELPYPLSFNNNRCYFKYEDNEGYLAVPIYEEEMKYFYANYKEYYYLPAEDIALHKTIATYVDKEFRINATASNCYARKTATFLPQWDVLLEPFFKRDYESKDLFFEVTDELKRDREFFANYASHVLNAMK